MKKLFIITAILASTFAPMSLGSINLRETKEQLDELYKNDATTDLRSYPKPCGLMWMLNTFKNKTTQSQRAAEFQQCVHEKADYLPSSEELSFLEPRATEIMDEFNSLDAGGKIYLVHALEKSLLHYGCAEPANPFDE